MRTGTFGIWLLLTLLAASPALSGKNELKIRSVRFKGNVVYPERRLRELMSTRPSRFLSRVRYHPLVLDEDVKNLILFYRQNGYLEALVTEMSVVVDSTAGAVDILLLIEEGELTRIEGIGVFGSTVFPDSVLLARTGMRKNDPFRRKRTQDASTAILASYADRGYIAAEVTPEIKIDDGTHRAVVDFMIRENDRYNIADIRTTGLEKTKLHVVERELKFARGDVVRYSSLLESQRDLYLTGLFKSVFVRPGDPEVDKIGTKDILIELEELESTEFSVSVGYGTVERARTTIGVINNNIAGSARKAGLKTRASFIQLSSEASFTEPWTFGSRWRTDAALLIEYLDEPGFDLLRWGGRAVIGRTFARRSTVSMVYRYEDADLSNIEVDVDPGHKKSRIRSLKASFVYDARDNLFNTKRGSYFEWSNEVVGAFLGGNTSFSRMIWRGKYFMPLTSSTIVGSAVEIGRIGYLEDSAEIPLQERFYAGGPNSLRGFGYRLAGPLDDDGTPTGGNFMIVWNLLEIRRAFYKMIGGVLFVDIGNVWRKVEHFKPNGLRSCAGIGLRANTPIGILRCDYGFNLDPEPGEDPGSLYFSVGHAF
jgi:outer membrane protein insertion porin family